MEEPIVSQACPLGALNATGQGPWDLFFLFAYFYFPSPSIMSEEHPRPSGPGLDKIENFNFLMSRSNPAAKPRQYSLDTDSGSLNPFGSASMEAYDHTEGMGGLSVSSYDSIDDDRSLDLRGYPYHGTFKLFCICCQRVASVAPSDCLCGPCDVLFEGCFYFLPPCYANPIVCECCCESSFSPPPAYSPSSPRMMVFIPNHDLYTPAPVKSGLFPNA